MNISSGIVLFNPDISRLKENINAVISQCEHLYLVDNGSHNINEINILLTEYMQSKISLICNSENKGIATALNQLVLSAQNEGFRWILTLDQDSIVPSDIIKNYQDYLCLEDVAILCPVICDRNKDGYIKPAKGYIEVDRCITSGSLLNIAAWQTVGGFDDCMFIDGVDFDLCYRLKMSGYKILRIQNVILLHELGHIEVRNFLIWKVIVKNHSSFRKYYIARNIIYIAKKRNSIALKLKAILQELKLLIIVVLYEQDKKNKVNCIFKGIYDGIKGKMS